MAIPKTDSKYNAVGRGVNCYFCNELVDEKSIQGHLMQCGAVLDPCPKKCGVYVQRNSKNKHVTECTGKHVRPRSTYDTLQRDVSRKGEISAQQKYLDNEVEALKLALEIEKQSRQEIEMQLQGIQNLHVQYLQRIKQLNLSLENLKHFSFDETEKRKLIAHENKIKLDQIYSNFKIIEEWKKGVDCDLQQIKYQLQENNNKIIDVEYELKDHDSRIISIDQVKLDNNLLKTKLEDEQIKWQSEFISVVDKLNKFQDFFQEENAVIGALWSDHTNEIKNLEESQEMQQSILNDIKAKYHALKFETKNVAHICTTTTDTVECQSKELKEIKKSIAQLKLDFELNANLLADNSFNKTSHNGHLLWRINNYIEKLENGKQNDTILNSPIIFSRRYGYKIRLQVYLNGIGKWKGRHIIISLQVLQGDWDPLLTWPCIIEAKVSLKNQIQSQGKDYTKSITAKRQSADEENEDPQESSSQYIFIPHATVEKQNFIQNNTIFFEIKIINDNLS